jgi:hypothetical protein
VKPMLPAPITAILIDMVLLRLWDRLWWDSLQPRAAGEAIGGNV